MLQLLSKFRNRQIFTFALLALLVLGSVQPAEAKWFGTEEVTIAHQHAYANTCVEVVEVTTYFFGIAVSSHLEQRPFQCG